jgi:hypothetical protein
MPLYARGACFKGFGKRKDPRQVARDRLPKIGKLVMWDC